MSVDGPAVDELKQQLFLDGSVGTGGMKSLNNVVNWLLSFDSIKEWNGGNITWFIL